MAKRRRVNKKIVAFWFIVDIHGDGNATNDKK